MRRGWALGLGALLALFGAGCACGGSDLDGGLLRLDVPPEPEDAGRDASFDAYVPPGSPLALALELFCDAQAYQRCTAPWACGCDYHDALPWIPDRPADVDVCVATERAVCDVDLVESLRAGLASGWTLDEAAARDCIAARRRGLDLCLPAPEAEALPGACRDALVTDAAIGAPCVGPNIRCGGGNGVCTGGTCEVLPSAGAACTTLCALGARCVAGTCTAAVAPSGACTDHEDCAGAELCLGGRCGAPLASGEPCSATSDCATGLVCEGGRCASPPALCESSATCGAASFCGLFPPSICRAAGSSGARCAESRECGAPLVCVRAELFGPGRCAPLPRLGEPCSGECEDDLRCFFVAGDSSHATCQPALAAGTGCGRDTIQSLPCATGLSCVAGVCGPPPGLDEDCTTDGLCAAGLVCLASDRGRRCAPIVAEGGACTRDEACEGPRGRTGLACIGGVCARPTLAAAGEACTFVGAGCAPGSDCVWAVDAFRCMPPGAPGEPCDAECAAGAWCDDLRSFRCIDAICVQLFPDRYPRAF